MTLLVVTVALIVGIITYLRFHDFIHNATSIADQSESNASSQISLHIKDLRRRISLFAVERKEFLQHLAQSPSDKESFNCLNNELKLRFPGKNSNAYPFSAV